MNSRFNNSQKNNNSELNEQSHSSLLQQQSNTTQNDNNNCNSNRIYPSNINVISNNQSTRFFDTFHSNQNYYFGMNQQSTYNNIMNRTGNYNDYYSSQYQRERNCYISPNYVNTVNDSQYKTTSRSNKSNKVNNKNYFQPQSKDIITFTSLDELKKELNKNDITLLQFIKTQKGSREMQKLLFKISTNDITVLINMLSTSIGELMKDKYGNYFCQKLIQNCSPEQRTEILKNVKSSFNEISCDTFGTHSLQVFVEISNMEKEQELLSQCIEQNIESLSCDQRGTHIVQKFFSSCSDEKLLSNIFKLLLKYFKHLVNDPHGVCVLIKALKNNHCDEEKKLIIKEIIKNGLEIIQNPFGNYIVQSLFNEHFDKEKELCMKLLNIVNENFFSLSMQKFSSNVVENSLKLNSREVLKKIIISTIEKGKMNSLIKNTYGNLVMEKLSKLLSEDDKEEIMREIESNGNEKTIHILRGILFK